MHRCVGTLLLHLQGSLTKLQATCLCFLEGCVFATAIVSCSWTLATIHDVKLAAVSVKEVLCCTSGCDGSTASCWLEEIEPMQDEGPELADGKEIYHLVCS